MASNVRPDGPSSRQQQSAAGNGLGPSSEKQPNMFHKGSLQHQSTFSQTQQQLFITSYTKGPETQLSIPDLFNQFNNIIESLDEKVDSVIERHEADFLTAYRNHMNKIKKELQEMKRKTDDQEKTFHENDRISGLEKQLNWYRDESLKLYSKLELKNKELDEYRMKLEESNKEKQFLEDQVKSLLKKNKYMEVKLVNFSRSVGNTPRLFLEAAPYHQASMDDSSKALNLVSSSS